jgi:predicted nucleotide-binding protein (sugar kinase/HSP70/actin superfamily)
MSQTGGQCRASSYVALIKKALIGAGYPQVPVIAMTNGEAISNDQPGFNFDLARILKPAFTALLYADAISRLYHKSIIRERQAGQALAIRDLFLERGTRHINDDPGEKLIDLLKEAVSEFNRAIYPDVHLPRIGIVGEIYLKFNRFSQLQVTDWIISQGVEVVVPSLLDFIIQIFVNQKVNQRYHIESRSLSFFKQLLLERQAGKWIGRFDRIMQGFHCYEPAAGIYHKARSAEAIINLASQFGEGWLIPGEIACYAQEGISDVVCLQPFGCTSNHVIAKGIERKIKSIYPALNLLFLDFDAGTSEVNVLNRLHFMVSTAKAQSRMAAYGHG